LNTWLLDTGPVVAYLDPRDRAHVEVVPFFDRFTGELFTTSAVVTEAMQFAARYPAGPGRLANFIAAVGLSVFDLTQPVALPEAAQLMRQYADLPMDFADATLILLAEQLGILKILTLDRRGFAVYRTRDGKPFHLVLDSA
jgi:predicted nucleic acid-binding protein